MGTTRTAKQPEVSRHSPRPEVEACLDVCDLLLKQCKIMPVDAARALKEYGRCSALEFGWVLARVRVDSVTFLWRVSETETMLEECLGEGVCSGTFEGVCSGAWVLGRSRLEEFQESICAGFLKGIR